MGMFTRLPSRVRISSEKTKPGGSPSRRKASPIMPSSKKGRRITANTKKTSIIRKISGGKNIFYSKPFSSSVRADFEVQFLQGNPQDFRGRLALAVHQLQGAADQLPLQFRQLRFQLFVYPGPGAGLLQAQRQIPQGQGVSLANDHPALDDILQLPDIPFPGVTLEGLEHLRSQGLNCLAVLGRVSPQEMVGQQRQVFQPLP